nr:hypothetical protein [Tanacetum cinerariifolium]
FINNDLEYLRGGASSPTDRLQQAHPLGSFSLGAETLAVLWVRLQDIKDMLLLLVQGKLYNLTVVERLAFNVSLRMFTRSIVIKSDGTLNDVRNVLDDRLKGILMQYLPTTIWRRGDKDKAAAMIQAIEKMLKTRMIMRSLEKFVGGRLYEGDFRML